MNRNAIAGRRQNTEPHEGLFGLFEPCEPPAVIHIPVLQRSQIVQPDDHWIIRGWLPSDEWIVNQSGKWLARARKDLEIFSGIKLPSPYAQQPEYLASEHWLRFRRERIRHAYERCESCGLSRVRCHERYRQDLNVHHLETGYARLGTERFEDTLVLCPRCHLREECAKIGHSAFIDVDGKRVRCVCGELVCK